MEGREGMMAGAIAAAAAAAAAAGGSNAYLPPSPAVEKADEDPSDVTAAAAPVSATAAPVGFLVAAPPPTSLALVAARKKRGRPRKYAPDRSVILPLNPSPISASAPPGGGEFRAKRGKGRPSAGGDLLRKPNHGFELVESLGELVACSAGVNFTPHIISVASGEDVTMKIISFSQQGPRAICILSANGVISNVTLRQPDSSGGTLTYEGRFELLSLSGSFTPTENGGTKSRHGGMSVSLASPDGRVVGGSIAGLLVAAGPVQVVIGSFMPGYQLEQKTTKRPRAESVSVSMPTTAAVPISSVAEVDDAYSVALAQQRSSSTTSPKATTSAVAPSVFKGDSWTCSVANSRSSTDVNVSLPSA